MLFNRTCQKLNREWDVFSGENKSNRQKGLILNVHAEEAFPHNAGKTISSFILAAQESHQHIRAATDCC